MIPRLGLLCVVLLASFPLWAQRQMETLGRGVVAVRNSSTQAYVGWRMLGTDPDDLGFNVYRVRSGTTNKLNGAQPLTTRTDYQDTPPNFSVANTYFVRPVLAGVEGPASGSFTIPAGAVVPTDFQNKVAPFLEIPLQVPPGGTTPSEVSYTYAPNDVSVGDLDGDGEYEYLLKWDPSNSKDNSQAGYTGNVLLDAYQLDGTLLWRIDLGINIRAGAHYTQFMVYDLDGDGRAEVACKTAPGTKDGLGNHVILPGDLPSADYRNSSGYILSGPEYLTVFDGLTGGALATTSYVPPRGTVDDWGDDYGNRVDRFLACVAYLDGMRPSLVMCRGYYTRAALAAWDWRNGQLTQRWLFDTGFSGGPWSAYKGQGNHNLSVGDVDGDGKDEIIYGACSIDDNGTGLYTTGLGHGDALHVSDMDPDRPGLEVWDVHETASYAGGGEFREARTGNLIYGIPGTGDTGRGLAAHVDGSYNGYQMWSSVTAGVLDRAGNYLSASKPSINFAVWWDADLQRELHDTAGGSGVDAKLDKWNGNGVTRILSPYSVAGGALNINGTKANPCLSGDLLGDWREEILLRSSDGTRLMMFIPVTAATNRFRTFLHDPQYRAALAWQNVAYNQPPHPGFYVGAGMNPPPVPLISSAALAWRGGVAGNVWDLTASNWTVNGIWTNPVPASFSPGHTVVFDLRGSSHPVITLSGTLQPGGVKVHAPVNYTVQGSGSWSGAMKLTKAGTGTLTLDTTNHFTGSTEVAEGTLLVNGSLGQSPVRVRPGVWLNSRLGGAGVLGQGVVVEPGCGLLPGNGTNAAGTLTVSNSLVLLGQVSLLFDLSNDPTGGVQANDRIQVFGNLSFSGTNDLELTPVSGVLGVGSYPLIQYTGALTGGPANLRLSEAWTNGASLAFSPGLISLVVTTNLGVPPPRQLVWRGGAGSNQWDVATTYNWLDVTSPASFKNGDTVTFTDVHATNGSVNLAGALQPASTYVHSASNYTFSGSGSLAGTNSLLKSGSGNLTLANSVGNTFTGGVSLEGGTLTLGAANTIGAGPVTLRSNATLVLGTYSLSSANPLTIEGTPSLAGGNGGGLTDLHVVTGSGVVAVTVTTGVLDLQGNLSGFNGTFAFQGGNSVRFYGSTGSASTTFDLGAGTLTLNKRSSAGTITLGALAGGSGTILQGAAGSGNTTATTYVIGGKNLSTTFAGRIINGQGPTSITKEGSATLMLAGTNTYTGFTTVSEGTLLINGDHSAATGPITVVGGALGGTGLIGGVAEVQSGGSLQPGNSIGTLTVSNTLTLAGNTVIEVNKSLAANDQIVAAAVNYGGTLTVVGTGTFLAGDSYPIFVTGVTAGSFAGIAGSPGPGLRWRFNPTNGALSVVSAAPPTLNHVWSGGVIEFSWSGSFKLQSQTNVLSAGLQSGDSNWFDYPGGGTSPVRVTNNPANPAVCFRLLSVP